MTNSRALAHINKYREGFLDAGTLRVMRGFAVKELAENERIRATMSEKVAKAEWDPLFEQDNIHNREAITRIDKELASRGLRKGI